MNVEKWIEHYLDKVEESGFEFDKIRKELTEAGLSEEEIKRVVKAVDNEIQNKALVKVEIGRGRSLMWTGLILMGLALGIYLGSSLLGWFGSGRLVVLPVGIFVVGVIVYLKGRF